MASSCHIQLMDTSHCWSWRINMKQCRLIGSLDKEVLKYSSSRTSVADRMRRVEASITVFHVALKPLLTRLRLNRMQERRVDQQRSIDV